MYIFIWKYLESLTDNYHSGGGLVIVAKDLESAMKLASQDPYITIDEEPSKIYKLKGNPEEAIFKFADAGCC